MAKVRLTKNELKKQKDSLKRFKRYLPMLQLKKKQLQLEIAKVHQAVSVLTAEAESLRSRVLLWVDLFAEEFPIAEYLKPGLIKTGRGNVAGIDLPVFLGVEFIEKPYDLLLTPLWVDKAAEAIKETVALKARLLIYHRQLEILEDELRIATQRVNLFEKVRIPEAESLIRVINIYLGEVQTAEVIRGKIAKSKIEKRRLN